MKKNRFKIKEFLPWLVAILIFYFLFREYPPDKIWQAAKYVKLGYFIPFVVIYFFIMYLIDSLVIKAP